MIQQTSLQSYQEILPDLGERQRVIYQAIRRYQPVSNGDLSRILQIPINSVTPRVKELREKYLVIRVGTKRDRLTQKTVMMWGCIQ